MDLDKIKKMHKAGTPNNPRRVVERIDHSDGEICYEINDGFHLVAFAERNHKEPIRAKFNAELYAGAPEVMDRLIAEIEKLRIQLYVAKLEARRDAIQECSKILFREITDKCPSAALVHFNNLLTAMEDKGKR